MTLSQSRVTMDHEANGMYTGINLSPSYNYCVRWTKRGKKRVESKVTRYVLRDGVTKYGHLKSNSLGVGFNSPSIRRG